MTDQTSALPDGAARKLAAEAELRELEVAARRGETSTASASSITFTPVAPIPYGGKTYPSLTLRKRKAKDMVAADLVSGATRKTFAVYASMADVPIGVIEELDADEFDRLEEVAAPLMGKSWKAREAREMEDTLLKSSVFQEALATLLTRGASS